MMRALALWALVVVSGAAGAAAQLHLRVNGKEAETHWLPITQEAGTQTKLAAHAAFSAKVVPDGMVGQGAKLTWTVGAPLAVPAEGTADWEDNVHLDDIYTVAVSVRAQCDNPALDITASTTVKTFGGPYEVLKAPWFLDSGHIWLPSMWGQVRAADQATGITVAFQGAENTAHRIYLDWAGPASSPADGAQSIAASGASLPMDEGNEALLGEPLMATYTAPGDVQATWVRRIVVREPKTLTALPTTWSQPTFVTTVPSTVAPGYVSRFRYVMKDQFDKGIAVGSRVTAILLGGSQTDDAGSNWQRWMNPSEAPSSGAVGCAVAGPFGASQDLIEDWVGAPARPVEGFCMASVWAHGRAGIVEVPEPLSPDAEPGSGQEILVVHADGMYLLQVQENLGNALGKQLGTTTWQWHRGYGTDANHGG